jgi:hypothetical protein
MTVLRGRTPTFAIDEGERIDLVALNGLLEGSLAIKATQGALSAGSASPNGKKLLIVGPGSDDSSAVFVGSVRSQRVRQLTQLGR